MGWSDQQKKAEDKAATAADIFTHFSDEDVEQWIRESQDTPAQSAICCAIQGLDGTAKSGIVLDCREQEEIDEHKKIFVIDVDGSVGPLKAKYWGNDPDIIIIDPVVIDENGHIDFINTYGKILANVRYLRRHENELNLAAVSLDGLDVLLKSCEKVMREVDLKLDPDAKVKDQWDWGFRNERFLEPLIILKRMKCRRFFVTHLKEKKMFLVDPKTRQKSLQTIGFDPVWESTTPNMMFQRIEMTRVEVEPGLIEIRANVIKCKTNLQLEGQRYVVATVDTRDPDDKKSTWHGLRDFFKDASINIVPKRPE